MTALFSDNQLNSVMIKAISSSQKAQEVFAQESLRVLSGVSFDSLSYEERKTAADLRDEVAALKLDLSSRNQAVAALNRTVTARDAEISILKEGYVDHEETIATQAAALKELEDRLAAITKLSDFQQGEIERLGRERNCAVEKLNKATQAAVELQGKRDVVHKALKEEVIIDPINIAIDLKKGEKSGEVSGPNGKSFEAPVSLIDALNLLKNGQSKKILEFGDTVGLSMPALRKKLQFFASSLAGIGLRIETTETTIRLIDTTRAA